jgi:hypothetical protein
VPYAPPIIRAYTVRNTDSKSGPISAIIESHLVYQPSANHLQFLLSNTKSASAEGPFSAACNEMPRPASAPGNPFTIPVQSNTKPQFGTGSLFGDYKPTPAPLFPFAPGAAPTAGGEQLFGQGTTGADTAPDGSGRQFGGFQPTPRPASPCATGLAAAGATAPPTGDREPFGQAKTAANALVVGSRGPPSGFQPPSYFLLRNWN